MLDWWFDIDNRICSVRMDERRPASDAVFDGNFRVRFKEARLLRSGVTYVYSVSDGHEININDVKFRGERYVSLYLDGKLIKEYNVHAEYYKLKYNARPEVYDSVKRFYAEMLPSVFAAVLIVACFVLPVLCALGIITTLAELGIYGGGGAAAAYILACLGYAISYGRRHRKMEKYSVISSVKRHKRTQASRFTKSGQKASRRRRK